MDLTCQVPMQYCSLHHWTVLSPTDRSTTGFCFSFAQPLHSSGAISPTFSSRILGTKQHGEFIFQCHVFCLFILFMWFSRQECWSSFPFPFPVDNVLSELSTMIRPSWVALHSMAHSFIELDKAGIHVISLVSFLWLCLVWTCNNRLFQNWERSTSGLYVVTLLI